MIPAPDKVMEAYLCRRGSPRIFEYALVETWANSDI